MNKGKPLTAEELTANRDRATHRITITLDESDYKWFEQDADKHHLPVITHARVILLNYKDNEEK